jgi:anthranilate synthase component I
MLTKPLPRRLTSLNIPAVSLPAPVIRELPADLETPVSIYLKLAGHSPSFLLESVTGGEQLARYSFIGVHPSRAYVLRGQTITCRSGKRRDHYTPIPRH